MLQTITALAAFLLLLPLTARAQDGKAGLEAVAKALGSSNLTSIQFNGTGANFAVGQSRTPGVLWPQFILESYARAINYDTASLRIEQTLVRVDTRGGGLPAMGEARQVSLVSGDHAWTVAGDTPSPQPRLQAELQTQLWGTPHGVVKAALANNGTMQRRVIAFILPGRFTVRAAVNDQNLIDRVEAVIPHPVLGDMRVEMTYSDYKDFGGVKFPTKIRQSAAGFPSLDLNVTDVQPDAAVSIQVPDAVRQTPNPYARVTTQMVADGVWYVTGGSHHSVAIEMRDHVILVESPLTDERALAVFAEVRNLVPNKPIRYVITSHHHFDHSGGLRAAAAEGATILTHESNRAFFERTLAARATVRPDLLAKSGRKGVVEGVGDKRVLTDGARSVEIYHIAGNLHEDGLLMVYLPKEKVLSQADTYTPAPPNTPPPAVVNPNSVNLADNITRLGLAVDTLLPLHGRMVPLAELNKAIGR